MFPAAARYAPLRISCPVSNENVENVVNAPRNPTRSTCRVCGEMAARSSASDQITPNRNDPSALTASVPAGRCVSESRWAAP